MQAFDWKAQWKRTGRLSSYAILGLALGLPAVLAFHSFLAARELRQIRLILFRDRAANIAARLEVMPSAELAQGDFDALYDGDSALTGVRLFAPGEAAPADPAVDAIRAGRELYRTGEIRSPAPVFRAYIPIHSEGRVYVARIDLAAAAPDLVLSHARRSVYWSIASGSLLLMVSLLALWSMRRAARLERRRMETERLAELGTLSGVLAHEIRNPLGAIKGFAQLARETAPEAAARPLDAIIRESRRLEGLVQALLLYGRPLKASIARTAWDPLAADLAAHARQLIGDRPIRFSSQAEIAAMDTDANLLKQALLNLIRNSVEAIPEGAEGEVRLRARPGRSGAVVVSVEDNGPGLPEEVRSKLFSPFVTTKASGTGLGLSISKKLAETLGGTLRMAAAEPHGARAELELYGANPRN